jgi:hypothetical protein
MHLISLSCFSSQLSRNVHTKSRNQQFEKPNEEIHPTPGCCRNDQ